MLVGNGLAFSDGDGDFTASIELPAHMLGDGPDELLGGQDDLVLGGPLLDLLLVLLEGLHLILVEGVDTECLGFLAVVHVAEDGDLWGGS